MQPGNLRDADEWLVRAERDLLLADRALNEIPVLADGAVFLAQQAAEKAFKGFLAAHGRPIQKTHDLTQLVPDCVAIEPGFAQFQAIAPQLSAYVTQFRYPGGPLEPPEAEARRAVEDARDIVDFVRQCVDARPSAPTI